MSGSARPPAPKISTSDGGRSVTSHRSPHLDSPSSARSNANSATMNARKRPADPRSRGHSPAEKRARGHQVASPPRSRTGSRAGVPENTPTGPARKTTESNADAVVKRVTSSVSKLNDDRRGSLGYSPLHMQSPRSGSGASTPVPTAPTVPSMLPKAGSDAPRTTMAALLRAKQTKQAILNAANARTGKADSNQLKNNEEHSLQLGEKTRALETTIQHLLGRVVELEKKTDLSGKDPTERIPKAEINEIVKAYVQEISTKVDKLQGETLQRVISAEEQLNKKIENEKENIKSLSSGFNTLADYKAISEQEIPERFENLVNKTNKIQEQTALLEGQGSILLERINEVDNNEAKTYRKANNNTKLIEDLERETKHLRRDMKEMRKTSLTREDADKILKDVTDMKLVVGQVKNFQSELGKLNGGHKRLTSGQDAIVAELKALKIRLDVLEKQSNSPAAKSETSVTKPSTGPAQADTQATAQLKQFGDDIKELQTSSKRNQSAAAAASERMELLGNDIKGLQSSAKENEATIALVTQLEERLRPLEQLPEKVVQISHIEKRLKPFEQLSEKFEALQTNCIDERYIDQRLKALEQLPQKVESLNERTSKLKQDATSLSDAVTKLNETGTAAKSHSSQRRSVQSQEQQIDLSANVSYDEQFTNLWQDMETLQAVVGGLQTKVHVEHAAAIDVLTNTLPDMLTDNFDPFKAQVLKDRDLTNTQLEALRQHVDALQQSSSAFEETKVALEGLRQEIIPLQNLVTNTSQCAQDISSLKQQLLEKVDANAIDEHMNNFRHSFRVLQDQYNNLTTDELHGKMVHWILQHYPTSTATMQQQYASLLQKVGHVQELYAQLSWIPPKKQDLVGLLENGPQQTSAHQATERTEEVAGAASQAMIKAKAVEGTVNDHTLAIQSLHTALSDVQQSLQNLNSVSFVKASVVDELKTTIEALGDRFTQLDSASFTLRQEHDALMQDFIEPNRETFAMFGQLLELVGQIQVFTESMYMSFPTKDGRSLLPRPPWLPLDNSGSVNGANKGKGKGKQ